jgi:HAD superfamily hydrolase (TIGR01490 family)
VHRGRHRGACRYPRDVPGADGELRAAAFFDLDKTVIAKASMVAFSGPLHRAGMLPRRLMLKAAWGQLVYAQFGATPEKLEKLREKVLSLTKGWDQAEISKIVRDSLEDVIEPIVFAEALERIQHHQAQGHKVFIVSASPEEVVAPVARLLGVDEAIATRAELDEHGRYSGRTERYVYALEKEVAILEVAARDRLDLSASWAYSDSGTDVPMLSAVGHPVAVNPDRELAKVANEREWPIEQWALEVRLRDRVPMPSAKQAGVGGGAAVLGAAAVAGWMWWRRNGASAPAAQTSRSFLDATKARLASTTRNSSFFMGDHATHAMRGRVPALGKRR